MECKTSDSKKLFKVFDASKRKRTRKKREGLDDTNSVDTDDSNSGYQATVCRVSSAKACLQDIEDPEMADRPSEHNPNRERDSSPSASRSRKSTRRHRRTTREGISLALKAGLVSTPRSTSPTDRNGAIESVPQDQDSFIYDFLEEAIKKDKKKQRHARKHEEQHAQCASRERDASEPREHRHHHHRKRRDDVPSKDHDKPPKKSHTSVEQTMLFETFVKMCAQMNDKAVHSGNVKEVPRTISNKSLQCEVMSRQELYDKERHLARIRSEHSREMVSSRIRSYEDSRRGHDVAPRNQERKAEKCVCRYDEGSPKCSNKLDVTRSRFRNVEDDRYHEYPPEIVPTKIFVDNYKNRGPPDRNTDYRDYDRSRNYEEEKRRYCEQKMSKSFDVHRDAYPDDDRTYRRTTRSDTNKEKRYEDVRDKRYEDQRDRYYTKPSYEPSYKPYDTRDRHTNNIVSKDRRLRKNLERSDRNSIASREEDYREKERDRYSDRERDSGLSVADCETSTVSGRSNYLRVVKQEIVEQREAMDKMMKLWKELMRCFKGISQTQGQDKPANENVTNVKESAAAQLRLWRECMRRYETVARDVGDTDARLMEEINKQRSEMAEMATMWQECLQRYRDMSNDFNSLKQQLVTSESPARVPAAPAVCAEGEGTVPPAPYRLPPNYPPMAAYPGGYSASGGGAVAGGSSPLRSRASAPPAWWWGGGGGGGVARDEPHSHYPRRRSSPDSRCSRDRDRDRDRRHRHKEHDESRSKEKSSKPNAARSEHRHRKR